MSSPPVGNAGSGKTTKEVSKSGGSPEEYSGLCATCNLAPSCSFREQSQDITIWECDLFESHESPSIIEIIEKYKGRSGAIIAILEEIQSLYGYIPPATLEVVARETGSSITDIYGVATFYQSFSLKPKGKHLESVCMGTACHVRGAPAVAKEFERELGVKSGETTDDLEFTLETVNCLGACALGPIVVSEGHYFSNVRPSGVPDIIEKTRAGLDIVDVEKDERVFPVEVNCPRCNHSLMDIDELIDGYPSIRVTLSFGDVHGWMRLSSLYGSYNSQSEYEIPKNTLVNFFCPHCHAELRTATSCPECAAPMVPLIVRGGGVALICSRSACKGHLLDLNRSTFEYPSKDYHEENRLNGKF